MMHVSRLCPDLQIPTRRAPAVVRPGLLTADAGNLLRAIADQVTVDLHDLETRFLEVESARGLSAEAVGYGRGVEEHVELIYSVVATASLAEYRRGEPDEKHRLPFACDADDVRARLDRIRSILLPLAQTVPAYYRSRRYRAEYARALSCLFLALDAIPTDRPDITTQILAFAPISQMSGDPQGDAQDYGERVDAAL